MALKSVDWKRVVEKCVPETKKIFVDTLFKHQDLKRQIFELNSSIPKFDWELYKPILEEEFINDQQERIKQFKPIKVDIAGQLKSLEKEEIEKVNIARTRLQEIEAEIKETKEKLQRLENSKPVDEMTVSDYYQMYPEVKEEFYERIRQENFTVSEPNVAKEEAH